MITKAQRVILASLYRARRPVSMSQLVSRTGYAWNTIKNNVKVLEDRGVVIVKRSTRRSYVIIDPNYKARLDVKRRRYYD
ncbi:MAG: hypothetical protein ABFQ65_04130 [Nanoarchaeota archaeon]